MFALIFAAENNNGKINYHMKAPLTDKLSEQQQCNLQLSENRVELLNTIRELIDEEIDRRCHGQSKKASAGDGVPTLPKVGREPPVPPPRRSLWQRLSALLGLNL